MAQFYEKRNSQTKSMFDSSSMFLNRVESEAAEGKTYFEVLNMFKRVFRGLNIRDLLS